MSQCPVPAIPEEIPMLWLPQRADLPEEELEELRRRFLALMDEPWKCRIILPY